MVSREQRVKKASQSLRLGSRKFNPIDFPATCAAENLPEERHMPLPCAVVRSGLLHSAAVTAVSISAPRIFLSKSQQML